VTGNKHSVDGYISLTRGHTALVETLSLLLPPLLDKKIVGAITLRVCHPTDIIIIPYISSDR